MQHKEQFNNELCEFWTDKISRSARMDEGKKVQGWRRLRGKGKSPVFL